MSQIEGAQKILAISYFVLKLETLRSEWLITQTNTGWNKYRASLGYRVRSCLKNQTTK